MRYNITRLEEVRKYNTRQYPLSASRSNIVINPGDIIIPFDGSYTICLRNGKLEHVAVAHNLLVKPWKVLVTEGNFPTEGHNLIGQWYPGCKFFLDLPPNKRPEVYDNFNPTNDLMCHCLRNQSEILFIHSRFVKHAE